LVYRQERQTARDTGVGASGFSFIHCRQHAANHLGIDIAVSSLPHIKRVITRL